MRSLHVSVLTAALCLAGPGLAWAADAAKDNAKSDVTAAYAAWDAAFNQHDAKALARAYEKNAELLPPTHEVAKGPAEIEKFFAGVIGSGVSNHRLELLDSGGNGHMVWAAARWSAEAKNTDGTVKKVGGLATHVFERDGKQLKLRMHSFN